MPNIATLIFTTDTTVGNLTDVFVHTNPNLALSNMQNYLAALVSGSTSGSMSVTINNGNATTSTGTLTCAAVAATNTAIVNDVTVTAVDGREKTTLTAVADVAGSLNSTYFLFSDAGNVNQYYVWYNINGAGVDPVVANRTGIVVLGATGATASALGGATRAAINIAAGAYITVSGAGTGIILQNILPGITTATADGVAATGFTIVRTITGAAISAVQFQIDASDTTTATNLKVAINAQADLSPLVLATSALGVVTVTAISVGAQANTITLAGTGNVTASAARLAGGTNNTTLTTYNFGR